MLVVAGISLQRRMESALITNRSFFPLLTPNLLLVRKENALTLRTQEELGNGQG